jgi:hypothetical protein
MKKNHIIIGKHHKAIGFFARSFFLKDNILKNLGLKVRDVQLMKK